MNGYRCRGRKGESPDPSGGQSVDLRIAPAVARGDDDQTDDHSVSRRSGDAFSHLVTRSHAEDIAIQTRRRRLGSS